MNCHYIEYDIYDIPDNEEYSTINHFIKNNGQLLNSDSTLASDILAYGKMDVPSTFLFNDKLTFITNSFDSLTIDSVQRIDMLFNKSNHNIYSYALDDSEVYQNYYLGHIPDGRERVPLLESYYSPEIQEKIDLICTHNILGPKFYLICKPGFNPINTYIEFVGQDSLSIVNDELIVFGGLNSISLGEIECFQIQNDGSRLDVSWTPTFSIIGDKVKFNLGSYNTSLPIIVQLNRSSNATPPDPFLNFEWSTFLADGETSIYSEISDVKVSLSDNNSSFYVGSTRGSDYPLITPGTEQIDLAGNIDVVVFKLNEHMEPQWGTYYGGAEGHLVDDDDDEETEDVQLEANEYGRAIYVEEGDNNVFVVGETISKDFPVEFMGTYEDDNSECLSPECKDGFILKLKNNGTREWATCYGSKTEDEEFSDCQIAEPYLISVGTGGANTPLEDELYTSEHGLIVKYDLFGQREMATLYPVAEISGVSAEGQSGSSYYITGFHQANGGLPILNNDPNFDLSWYAGSANIKTGFVAKLNTNSDLLEMSQAFSCTDDVFCRDVEVDVFGDVYVVGYQEDDGSNFDSLDHVEGTGYFQADALGPPQNPEGFIIKMNSSGIVQWSTYFGSTAPDWIDAIASDEYGNIIFGGRTYSGFSGVTNDIPFPDTNPIDTWIQDENLSDSFGSGEGFFSMMNPEGNLIWTSYFGGAHFEAIRNFDIGNSNKLYGVGITNSAFFILGQNEFPWIIYENEDVYQDWYQDDANIWTEAILLGFGFRFDLSEPQETLNIVESSDAFSFNVYPNPSYREISISFNNSIDMDKTINVYDISGRLLDTRQVKNEKVIRFNVDRYESGQYCIEIISNNNRYLSKFIKMKGF